MKKLIEGTIIASAMVFTTPFMAAAQHTEVSEEVVTYNTPEMEVVEVTRTERDDAGNAQMRKDTFFKEIDEAKTPEEIEAAKAKLLPRDMEMFSPELNMVLEDKKQQENDAKAEKLFGIIDMDADGFITKQELINFHRKVSQKKEEKMMKQMQVEKMRDNAPRVIETHVTETTTETSYSE